MTKSCTSINFSISIIIINYNYEKFLSECIESILNQSYSDMEVILVDDGSTDNSREIAECYSQIKKVYKANGGMISAANAGFVQSRGNLVMFVDADDYLNPEVISSSVPAFSDNSVVMCHFRLQKTGMGNIVNRTVPSAGYCLSSGDVLSIAQRYGKYIGVPTSGNIYRRSVLEKLLPPSQEFTGHGQAYLDQVPLDAYLAPKIPWLGKIVANQQVGGVYRIHGKNNGASHSSLRNWKKIYRSILVAKSNQNFLEGLGPDKKKHLLFDFQNIVFVYRWVVCSRINKNLVEGLYAPDKSRIRVIFSSFFISLKNPHAKSRHSFLMLVLSLLAQFAPRWLVRKSVGIN